LIPSDCRPEMQNAVRVAALFLLLGVPFAGCSEVPVTGNSGVPLTADGAAFAVGPRSLAQAAASSAVQAPGPSPALFITPYYKCLRTFYVATNGKDANAGTSPAPRG